MQIGRWVDKRRQAEDAIESEVACARTEGMSWAKVGLALGTSAQAAWQRYGLTPEQRRGIALQQERGMDQLRLDLAELPSEVAPLKQPRRKQKRDRADR